MQKIIMRGNTVALVDDEDYEYVKQFHWYPDRGTWTTYAKTDALPKRPRLHAVIMKPTTRMYVDHLDRDGLNCQRSNLEIVTPSINSFRAKKYLGVVPFRGVSKHQDGKYMAQITVNYKKYYLGLFNTPEEASRAYLVAVEELRWQK